MERYAPEHLEIQCKDEDLEFYHGNLINYGSIFLGEGSTVTHGDKTSGTNHVLPTRRVARYTGGLGGEVPEEADLAETDEGVEQDHRAHGGEDCSHGVMEGHARACDVRLEKYFPGEEFNLQPKA